MGLVFSFKPFNLIYFFLNLQALQIIKFWLVTLERTVHSIFTIPMGTFWLQEKNSQRYLVLNIPVYSRGELFKR